ncbi:cell surface protein [Marinifilum breve]|uniref:Cell surface protein n=1 Tax=Marinifilum breve TaxID=2184082 RepID=A0A2V3ZTP3_9BACT|nr:PKD-like domain-containing protein [Marinifilum breve]PXX97082.1 cell surface protein [Marinifilum breve]
MKKTILNGVLLLLCSMVLCLHSCDDDDVEALPPTIGLEGDNVSFNVKIGKTLNISPVYKFAEDAVFAWKIDGKIVSTSPALEYEAKELGDKFLTLDVVNSVGSAFLEMKISIVDLILPKISINIPENGFTIVKGSNLDLKPNVENGDNSTYSWSIDGQEKATTKDYSFSSAEVGDFTLTIKVTNEDGSDQISIPIKVCNAEDLPFSWVFDQTEYNMSKGRTIRLKAYDISNAFGGEFIWTVDGKEEQKGELDWYAFSSSEQGKHTVSVTMKNDFAQVTQNLIVNVCAPEGTYKRQASSAISSSWNKVYSFLPAPGQFVNENYNVYTNEEAVQYAEERLQIGGYVSLGGFGGSIVLGFDHSIENDGDYNIQIKGNSFKGSSEPGIVWVMQDENGDGLPNDTWYELKGSDTESSSTIKDYAVTYYKPKSPGLPVQWTDNQGNNGCVDYLGSFHTQDYYYPLWVETESYTLRGTRLEAKTKEVSPGYWENDEFEWGYVDNYSSVDRLTNDDNQYAGANGNHFKISNAIKYDGSPANLKYIDFVKVVVGVNTKAGWLGEMSTEVFGVNDFNLIKK